MSNRHSTLTSAAASQPGVLGFVSRLQPMPHEIVFGVFLSVCWLRLVFVSGVLHPMSLLYLGMMMVGLGVMLWERRQPTPLRARLRVLFCAGISAISYMSVKTAIPAMNARGFQPKDGLLESLDRALIGDAVAWLQQAGTPLLTEVMMACYLFFFYYLIVGPGYYYFTDHHRFIAGGVGFFTVYGLGYIGYMLVPAAGPCEAMGLRTAGIISEIGGGFVGNHTNGFDAFPSIHFAATFFLLGFDWCHHRRRFWQLLLPVLGLWVSTIYLRYHYLVDLIAGLVVALFALWIADRFARASQSEAADNASLEAEQAHVPAGTAR
ncbi:MAG: phosphoesterase PA-phosphatase [Pedosphaera sp.]|nr:phosphoesterase PA-phosphatase [Pedosphaera sp.]MSU42450.1 phosphoesterase PA-phosphatase [Pedosphaera sp.]